LKRVKFSAIARFAQAIAFVFLGALLFASCAAVKPVVETQEKEVKTPPKKSEVSFVAVGDNLIHKPIINAAKISGENEYDFKPIYSEIRSVIQSADLAFINQETLVAGEKFGYSGYPQFNGPFAIGEAIIDTGFKVINHATNHAYDKGKDAILKTIENYKKYNDILLLGIHASLVDRIKDRIVTINGISIGFLSYAYGLNGFILPENAPYLVSLIDKDVMKKEIESLRPKCDFLIVSTHWGEEYKYKPNKEQEKLALFFADLNVDLVIGHHPHTLESVKWVEGKDKNKTLVYYSLGNFLSAQNKTPRMLGGMANMVIKKDGAKTYIENPKLTPLITHYNQNFSDFKVYLLKDYNENLSKKHRLYNREKDFNLAEINDLFAAIVSSEFRE
jgi:poly-gamma-glutamate synthesis protein (capsule biosynthesis protein)